MTIIKEATVYLGLGTNQGDRIKNLQRAIEELSSAVCSLSVAPVIESESWGYESSNSYLNTVAVGKTTLSPIKLLQTTEEIERRMGRTKKSADGVYSDRPIDIDILFYDNQCINTERLKIPHPLLHKRLFVLQPMAQLAPHYIHPTIGKSIEQLLQELQSTM